jgi:hypothetical protein
MWGRLTPDGWPDDAATWMNTGAILQRIRFGLDAGAGRLPGIHVPPLANIPPAARVDSVIAHVLLGEATPETRAILLTGINPLAPAASEDSTPPNGRMTGAPLSYGALLGLAIGAPDFQRR